MPFKFYHKQLSKHSIKNTTTWCHVGNAMGHLWVFSGHLLMRRARGHSRNHSRLWSEQPVEWGGLVDGMQRTSQWSRVSDSESDIGCTSLQQSRPIRAQWMKTTIYQPTKTSWIPRATVTVHKARPTLGKYNRIDQGKWSADVKTLISQATHVATQMMSDRRTH